MTMIDVNNKVWEVVESLPESQVPGGRGQLHLVHDVKYDPTNTRYAWGILADLWKTLPGEDALNVRKLREAKNEQDARDTFQAYRIKQETK